VAKIVFVLDDMFEDSEFKVPYDAVREAGHDAVVVGLEAGKKVTGKRGRESFVVELGPEGADAADYDALVIPGGFAPDKLRMNDRIVALVRDLTGAPKPVAAICHAGWLLAEADVVRGRTVTSYPSIRTDLRNAGATWVDEEVVVDGNLITSRRPDDLPAFCKALLEQIG
jgi:protease I